MPLSLQWIGLAASVTVFIVMFALGLMLSRVQLVAAAQRPAALARVVFAVVVLMPALAVLALHALAVRGPVAVGIVLMVISPGAPVALRRALDAGGHRDFAPSLHLVIVLLSVLTVPLTVRLLDWLFSAEFAADPLPIGRQVFFAQLLPLALGAGVHALRPALAERLAARLAPVGNVMLVAILALVLVDLPALLRLVGWTPLIAGTLISALALGLGAATCWREASVRRVAAIAVAMRNPGLALLLATANRAPAEVTATVIGYALGLALALVPFLVWCRRR